MAKKFSGGMGGGVNMNMIKQAQRMQQEMLKTQQELEEKEFSASSGGGAVTAKVNGRRELLSVKISPETVDPEDVEILEDLVVAAVNQASKEAEDAMEAAMKQVTGGMSMPGLF